MNNNQTSDNENSIVLKTSVDKLTHDLMKEFEKNGTLKNSEKGIRVTNEDMIGIQNAVANNLDGASLQKSLQGGVRMDVQKPDKGLKFPSVKQTELQPFGLPSGEYSQSDLEGYKDSLLKSIQEQKSVEMKNMISTFLDKIGISSEVFNSIQVGQNSNFEGKVREKNETAQKWIMPCRGKITSPYGWRIHPTYGTRKFHDGVDIGVSINTPVKACAGGKVVKAQWNGGYGKYIEIDHGNNIHSFYGHLNEICVKVGDIVSLGQIIAKSGNTAGIGKNGKIMTTGPHLHFGVHKSAQSINPLEFVRNF